MNLVILASGGLDSTLISVMAKEEGITTYPLFIDYGQLAAKQEWEACNLLHKHLQIPLPKRIDLSGFGKVISSGLISLMKDVNKDAFTPGRNLLFLLIGCAYAYQIGAEVTAIGLLAERFSLFPDQSEEFIASAEVTIEKALGRQIKIITPLSEFSKSDVIRLAKERGIRGTYSCHSGEDLPCGLCISCLELANTKGG